MESKKSYRDALLQLQQTAPAKTMTTRKWLKFTSKTIPTRGTILSFPYDIMVMIFQNMELGLTTCLGLTCRRFYMYLKIYYPEPILLWNTIDLKDPYGTVYDDCTLDDRQYGCRWRHLGQHLQDCGITKGYRLPELPWLLPWQFLNEKVYGTVDAFRGSTEQEVSLSGRYRDYRNASVEGMVYMPKKGQSYLPYPYNTGEAEWVGKALDAIRLDSKHERFGDWKDWKSYWERFEVVNANKEKFEAIADEVMWEMWSEGMALLEF